MPTHPNNTSESLLTAIDAMMVKLGYLVQDDRTVSIAIVRENFLIQKALDAESYEAYQKYQNERNEIRDRHAARVNAEFAAHRQRLADSQSHEQ